MDASTPWANPGHDVQADIDRMTAEWGAPAKTGHLTPPPPVPALIKLPADVPMMGSMVCGGCGGVFMADPTRTPVLMGWPCCLTCWDKRAMLRSRVGLPMQGRPLCYPEDYQEGNEPWPS